MINWITHDFTAYLNQSYQFACIVMTKTPHELRCGVFFIDFNDQRWRHPHDLSLIFSFHITAEMDAEEVRLLVFRAVQLHELQSRIVEKDESVTKKSQTLDKLRATFDDDTSRSAATLSQYEENQRRHVDFELAGVRGEEEAKLKDEMQSRRAQLLKRIETEQQAKMTSMQADLDTSLSSAARQYEKVLKRQHEAELLELSEHPPADDETRALQQRLHELDETLKGLKERYDVL